MTVYDRLTERCKTYLEEIAREEGFEAFELKTTQGSLDGDNFLGEIIKAIVSGKKKDGSNKTLNLIVKISVKKEALRINSFIQQFYKREIEVYTKMLPTLNKYQKRLSEVDRFKYAKLYKSWIDENDEFLILEDLYAKGFVLLDKMKPFDHDHLVFCIKNLATFHATSIAWKADDPVGFDEMASHSLPLEIVWVPMTQYLGKSVPTATKLIKGKPYEATFSKFLDNLINDMETLWKENLDLPHGVLSHGDCWINNVFFNYQNGKPDRMIFIDWQLMRKSSPVVDLAYLLTTGLNAEMRSKYYYKMINLYYEFLSSSVTKMGLDITKYYPEPLYREDVKKYVKLGFIISFGLMPLILCTGKTSNIDIADYVQGIQTSLTITDEYTIRMQELIEDSMKYNFI